MSTKKQRAEANWVCHDCGIKYGEPRDCYATYHLGKCDVCGEEKAVTEPRDYNYLRKTK